MKQNIKLNKEPKLLFYEGRACAIMCFIRRGDSLCSVISHPCPRDRRTEREAGQQGQGHNQLVTTEWEIVIWLSLGSVTSVVSLAHALNQQS